MTIEIFKSGRELPPKRGKVDPVCYGGLEAVEEQEVAKTLIEEKKRR